MGSALFAKSHRDVYNLFKAWGFEDGAQRGDGHHRMVWPATGQVVQIMPPNRRGSGELGNAQAMKKARRILGITLQQFLAGPVEEKPIKDIDSTAMERARTLAELLTRPPKTEVQATVADNKEDQAMPRQTFPTRGITPAIEDFLFQNKGVEFTAHEVGAEMVRQGFYPDADKAMRSVYGLLGGLVVKKSSRVKKGSKPGLWVLPKQPVPYNQDIAPVIPTPPAPEKPKAVVTNGKVPELLSRLAPLGDGKYLFQGDDDSLYVVRATKLNTEAV